MSSPQSLRYAYDTERISVTILDSGILYINWTGPQDLKSIRREGARLLDIQRELGVTKVVNSNLMVTTGWDEALPYVADEWFPAMARHGLRYFAWVLPLDAAALNSVNRVMSTTPVPIQTFPDFIEACMWLYSMPDTHNLPPNP